MNGGGEGRCLVGAPLPAMAAAARRAAGMIGARAGRVQGGLAGRLLTSRMLSPTGSAGVVEAALAALTRGSGELGGGLGSEGWGGWGGGERGWSNLDCIPGPLAVAGAFPSWRRAFEAMGRVGGRAGDVSGKGGSGRLRRSGEALRGARQWRWSSLGAFVAAAEYELTRARSVGLPPTLFAHPFFDQRWWPPFSALATSSGPPLPRLLHHPSSFTPPLHHCRHWRHILGCTLSLAGGGRC